MYRYENILVEINDKHLPLSGTAGTRGFIEHDPLLPVALENIVVNSDGLYVTAECHRPMTGLYPSTIKIHSGSVHESIAKIVFNLKPSSDMNIPPVGITKDK